MATTSQAGAASQGFYDEAVERIEDAGLRLTPQRTAILELFARRDAHMTPQGIFEVLEGELSSLSLATVYNSLEVFEEIGIVDRVCLDDGQTYFDPNTTPHQHAICQKCEAIFDLEVESSALDEFLETMASADAVESRFSVDSVNVWLKGLCADCQ